MTVRTAAYCCLDPTQAECEFEAAATSIVAFFGFGDAWLRLDGIELKRSEWPERSLG